MQSCRGSYLPLLNLHISKNMERLFKETLIKAFPAPDLRRKAADSKKEALLLFVNTVRIRRRR